MGEIFRPSSSKNEKIKRLSRELQISEERAKKLLQRRRDMGDLEENG